MLQLAVWKMPAREPQVVKVLVPQCMTGLRGPRSGLPIKKPSEFWASDETLIAPLRGLLCDGQHEHSQLDAREAGAPADKAKDAARWALPLCHRVARGCEDCLRKMSSQQHFLETAGNTAQSATLPSLTTSTKVRKGVTGVTFGHTDVITFPISHEDFPRCSMLSLIHI